MLASTPWPTVERATYEEAMERLNQCARDIAAYFAVLGTGNPKEALFRRLEISRQYAWIGTYVCHTDRSKQVYGVYGVHVEENQMSRERAFLVNYAPIDSAGYPYREGLITKPLVEYFLKPVKRDGNSGERFTRVGDFFPR